MNFDARENQAAPCYSAPSPVVIAIESTERSMDEKWKTQYCAFGLRSARKMEQQVTVKAAVTRNLQRKAVSLDFELVRTNEFP